MALYLIGLGLHDEKDITVRGLEIVRRVKAVYLENYTSVLSCSVERLEDFYGRKVVVLDRDAVEKGPDEMLDQALDGDVAFLVVGDPMGATTHIDLVLRAHEKGVKVEFINNASVLTAIGVVGLELYKYGKTTSIVFPQEGWVVDTPYDVIRQNQEHGLHTLCLLDIKVSEPSKEALRKGGSVTASDPRFMTVNQAIQALLDIESRRGEKVFTDETLCIGCARLGSPEPFIRVGKAKDLLGVDFGAPLHSLIVPGKLHFMEEDALRLHK
ncbi:TPA: diphthine synthase [Candidatus Woesearchaeota archaeon]|nr:diphthine synthase [Candidatus Woesearchaeota archaeon]